MAEKSKAKRDSLYQINRRTVFKITKWSYVPKGHMMTHADSLKMQEGNKIKVTGQEASDTTNAPVPEEERNYVPPVKNQPAPPKKQGPSAPDDDAIMPENN